MMNFSLNRKSESQPSLASLAGVKVILSAVDEPLATAWQRFLW